MASILRNYNYVKKLLTIPCGSPDWLVIIETAAKTAPPALLSLFLPGCEDIVKTRLGTSPWHAKGIRTMIKGVFKPFPVSEQKFLYKIGYVAAERFLWYYMVADVTQEFYTTWQSAIYQQQQCQLPGAGTGYGYFAPFFYAPNREDYLIWSPIHAPFGIVAAGGQLIIQAGFQSNMAYSVEWITRSGAPAKVTTWLEVTDNPVSEDLMTTFDPTLKNGKFTQGSHYHELIGETSPFIYRVGLYAEGDEDVQPFASQWSCSLHGRANGNTTFGCHPKKVTWPFPNPLAGP